MDPWKEEFRQDLETMDNRELFDLYASMNWGSYWIEEDLDRGHSHALWMLKEVEDELSYRLRDWFGEDEDEEFDTEEDDDYEYEYEVHPEDE